MTTKVHTNRAMFRSASRSGSDDRGILASAGLDFLGRLFLSFGVPCFFGPEFHGMLAVMQGLFSVGGTTSAVGGVLDACER